MATLAQLHAGYRAWLGTPETALEFRRPAAPPHGADELDVLVFRPEERSACLATAGMSAWEMDTPLPRAELVVRVDGPHDPEEIVSLGRALAELAVLPRLRGCRFQPDWLLTEATLPLFPGTTTLLLTDWAPDVRVFLPGVWPAVVLLRVLPLEEEEAGLVRRLGDAAACRLLAAAGVYRNSPARPHPDEG